MISRSQIKYVNSLRIPKYRERHRTFIAEGPKLLSEILASPLETEMLFATADWLQDHQKWLKNIRSQEVTPAELDKISQLATPNKVLGVVRVPHHEQDVDDLENNLSIALNDIRDPGNMGTIIRSADWFGVNQVICSRDCVDVYNPKVVQATMGSIARVKVHYLDLAEFFSAHPNLVVYGAVMDGENIYRKDLTGHGVILIGNESHGIPEWLSPHIDQRISIPSSMGSAESLNASIAASIILSEFRRQSPAGKQK